ncbi:MAG: rhomboid family intramembrane serine protease, partial [Anaerolineae bacterium]|nr:rhomboid family intramembrane serine protease [Anaerolineae bacterium]
NEAHILFNSLALYYIGSNVERLFGHTRFALIYFLGGLAGSIAMLFAGVGGLGASGAVFAIWGAEVAFFYKHRALFGAVAQARLRSSLIFMGMNFFLGFAANAAADITNAENAIRIGNSAHLGGLIGGGLLAWLIQPHFVAERIANPQPGQVPIQIVQTNKLIDRVRDILFYCVALAGLLLLAIWLS